MTFKAIRSDRAAAVVAAAALAAAGARRATLPRPADATAFHARVKAVAAAVPATSGDWVGTDVPLPVEAVEQLRPNVAIQRRYVNRTTGRTVSLLLVQCADVRDLAPHYPPVCYPGQGLVPAGHEPVSLDVGLAAAAAATRYTFEWDDFRHGDRTRVDNFMVLPDGQTRPDMTGMDRRIGAAQRFLGAAQVQVVYGTEVSPAEQTADTEQILRPYRPLLVALGSGAQSHE